MLKLFNKIIIKNHYMHARGLASNTLLREETKERTLFIRFDSPCEPKQK